MSLASLIKKGSLRGPATATVATLATVSPNIPPCVATVATVAVAKAPDTAANDPAPTPAPDRPRAASLALDAVILAAGTAADPDRWSYPRSTAMNTAEIDRFTARLARFTDRGVILSDAERLADLLVIRDREQDDRALCLECTHLQRAGRCGNWQAAGVAIRARDAFMPVELVRQLQRCDGFTRT